MDRFKEAIARTIVNNRKKSTTRGKQSPRKPSAASAPAASAPAPRRASQSPRASPHSPQDIDETEKRFRAIECSIKKIELQLKLVDGEIMSNNEYAALTAEIIKCDAYNPDNLGEGTDFIMSVNNKRMDNRYKYILKVISIINPLLTACNIGFLQEIDTKEVSSELIGDAIKKTTGYLNTLRSAINYFLENGNDGADKIDKLMDLNILSTEALYSYKDVADVSVDMIRKMSRNVLVLQKELAKSLVINTKDKLKKVYNEVSWKIVSKTFCTCIFYFILFSSIKGVGVSKKPFNTNATGRFVEIAGGKKKKHKKRKRDHGCCNPLAIAQAQAPKKGQHL